MKRMHDIALVKEYKNITSTFYDNNLEELTDGIYILNVFVTDDFSYTYSKVFLNKRKLNNYLSSYNDLLIISDYNDDDIQIHIGITNSEDGTKHTTMFSVEGDGEFYPITIQLYKVI